MSITSNIVSLPITLAEMATLLSTNNVLKNVCLSSTINKWSAVKPVDLNRVAHTTYDGLSDINFGLVAQAINPSVNGRIATKPTFEEWTYQRPQGGATSPFRLDDFCVYASASSTTQKGYKHDAQSFLTTTDCNLDVENGQATVHPFFFVMNGSRYPANSTTENINIDLKNLSLDYKSTSEQGSKITEANRRITCGYWRFGVVIIVPLYTQDATGTDTRSGMGAYLCCAKDTISTSLISNITTQSIRYSYGCDNALLMMKRAMLYDDSNTYFEALPVLVFNSTYNEDSGVWSTPSKVLTFPSTGYIKLNMSNMLVAKMTLSTHSISINDNVCTPVPNYGFAVSKATVAALTTSATVVSIIGVTITKPSGDNWSNPDAYIVTDENCTFTQSTSSNVVTFRITWTKDLISRLKSAVGATSVGSVVSMGNARIKYLSEMKGASVKIDVPEPLYVVS